jgi:hypothetical protein
MDYCMRWIMDNEGLLCRRANYDMPSTGLRAGKCMDFITTLPETIANHDAVMVIVDKLTKLVMCIPTITYMDTV